MALNYIYGQDERCLALATRLIGVVFNPQARAIGVERGGVLIAAIAYDGYVPGTSMNIHVAALPGARWCTHETLRRAFAYPFLQLKCKRVTGLVAADNVTARKLDEHLGFVQEGVMRDGAQHGGDLIVYGMLPSECRWI